MEKVSAVQMISKEILLGFGGVFIGGIFTLLGAWVSPYFQKRFLRKKERETLRSVMRALKLEFEEFWESYKNSLQLIEKLYPEQQDKVIMYIKQEHFTIYNSNVSIFSQLQDEELQRLIVKTHMIFCVLLDRIEFRNVTINKMDEYAQLYINSEQEFYRLTIKLMKEELGKQLIALKEAYKEIDSLMSVLIPKLDETIQSLSCNCCWKNN